MIMTMQYHLLQQMTTSVLQHIIMVNLFCFLFEFFSELKIQSFQVLFGDEIKYMCILQWIMESLSFKNLI